jgi:hypothetical protein
MNNMACAHLQHLSSCFVVTHYPNEMPSQQAKLLGALSNFAAFADNTASPSMTAHL